MMGRNHALLGAAGYAAIVPSSFIEVAGDRTLVTAAWAVGTLSIALLPAERKSHKGPGIGFLYLMLLFIGVASVGYLLTSFLLPYTLQLPETASNQIWRTLGIVGLTIIWGGAALLILSSLFKLSGAASSSFYKSAYRWMMIASVIAGLPIVSWVIMEYAPWLMPDNPIERAAWLVFVAGVAVWPDIDEPNSTISRIFGPVSRAVSKVLRRIAGGHRNATHSWIMVVIVTLLAILSQFSWITAGIMFMIAFIMATRLLIPDKSQGMAMAVMVLGAVLAWGVAFGNVSLAPMLLAAPAGILLHVAGDWLTNSGVPFWYPHKKKYAARIFATNSATEYMVVRPILIIGLLALIIFWIVIPFIEWSQTPAFAEFFQDYVSISKLKFDWSEGPVLAPQ